MISAVRAAQFAESLEDAQVRAEPIAQFSATAPLEVDAAYQVQHALIARRVEGGDRVVGLKLGFTSRAKARQMGVEDVILGTLTAGMQIPDGGAFEFGSCIHPRVEPEVAYLLGSDVDAHDGNAIAAVAPAIEIIDSRYRNFQFDLGDVVADNTSAAGFAIGPWMTPAEAGRIDNRAVLLEVDDRLVQTGSTSAILGHPARALAVARRLAATHGFALRSGMILLAGAATVAIPLPQRGIVETSIAGLGRVRIRIEQNGASK
ncbi:fumarylacetoacetate hydrolase family protein [Microbacterium lacus]|uniref:2-keto-4-pentenoate hydratase n=1 Tax=Microbacterium lacus TaxID=415217 RepID=UPI00384FC394